MATRVTQTTQQTDDVDQIQPISFSFSAPEDREVKMVFGRRGASFQAEPPAAAANRASVVETAAQPSMPELIALGTWAQSFTSLQQQQIAMLRDFDVRLAELEGLVSARPTSTSTERATWWALWGLLMLILGGALTILILLIFFQDNSLIVLRR